MKPVARIAPLVLAFVALSVGAAETGCKLDPIFELPVTMFGTRPLIKGTINGNEAQFLLDSGATAEGKRNRDAAVALNASIADEFKRAGLEP